MKRILLFLFIVMAVTSASTQTLWKKLGDTVSVMLDREYIKAHGWVLVDPTTGGRVRILPPTAGSWTWHLPKGAPTANQVLTCIKPDSLEWTTFSFANTQAAYDTIHVIVDTIITRVDTLVSRVDTLYIVVGTKADSTWVAGQLATKQAVGTYLTPADSTTSRNYSDDKYAPKVSPLFSINATVAGDFGIGSTGTPGSFTWLSPNTNGATIGTFGPYMASYNWYFLNQGTPTNRISFNGRDGDGNTTISLDPLNGVITGKNLTLSGMASGTLRSTAGVVSVTAPDTVGLGTSLAGKQPLDGDLTAIAAMSATGTVRRTGADTWTATASDTVGLGTALAGKEPALGVPDTSGKVLSSTTGGVRSWVTMTSGGGGGGDAPTTNVMLVSASFTPSSNKFTTIRNAIYACPKYGTVIIYPGFYDENVRLKDGVDLYFMPGAVLKPTTQYYALYDSGSSVHCGIFGAGVIVNNADQVSREGIYLSGNSSIHGHLQAIFAGYYGIHTNNATGIDIMMDVDTISAINRSSGNVLQFTGGSATVKLHARYMYSNGPQGISLNNTGVTAYITCDYLESYMAPLYIVSGATLYYKGGVVNQTYDYFNSGCRTINNAGTAYVTCDVMYTKLGLYMNGTTTINDATVFYGTQGPAVTCASGYTRLNNVRTAKTTGTYAAIDMTAGSVVALNGVIMYEAATNSITGTGTAVVTAAAADHAAAAGITVVGNAIAVSTSVQ